jgi:hypothetical protein
MTMTVMHIKIGSICAHNEQHSSATERVRYRIWNGQQHTLLPRCEHRAVSVLTDRIDPGRIACRVCLG